MTNTQKYKMQYTPNEIASLCELLADTLSADKTQSNELFIAIKHAIALAFALGRTTQEHVVVDFGGFFADLEEGARDSYMEIIKKQVESNSYSLLELAKKYRDELPAQSVIVKPRRSRYLETGMMPEKEFIAAGLNQEFDDGPITAEEKLRMSNDKGN